MAILFKNSFQFEILKELYDEAGNCLFLSMKVNDLQFTIAAVYGPNTDEPTFFKRVQQNIEILGNSSVIIGGDWNVPLDYDLDTLNYVRKNNEKSQKVIHEMLEELDLVDTFRELYPNTKRYSWRGPGNKQARLDYFLVSTDLQYLVNSADIEYAYRSDHSPIYISLSFNEQVRGKGSWKFNNRLLYDTEYVRIVKDCIQDTIKQYKNDNCENLFETSFSIDDQLLWETIKLMIRGKTISYSSFKKKERVTREKNLEEKLTSLNRSGGSNGNETNKDKILEVELELKKMRDEKIRGIIMRSKAKWNIEGERSTKYFCNLEKRHFIEKVVPKLILDNDEEITDQREILREQRNFYKKLYTSNNLVVNNTQADLFFDANNPFISKLSVDESQELEGKLEEKEVLCALKEMKNGKSPGIDGFTSEFYKFFWSDLKYFILRSFNFGYDKGCLSISQRQGVITCLPKEGKSKFFLKNWRPISLLNVDYKISSSCIARRFKKVLSKLISNTQTGFIKGRYIGECTRLICDLIEKCEENEIPGLLILLDFEKAFDSLEWDFIKQALQFFGFGSSILQWVSTFYSSSESCVLNNGHFSERFYITRGVRQGDPLSPYLFILSVELLSAALKYDPNISGIKINNSEYLISQYADDSTLMLDEDPVSVNQEMKIIYLFSTCSGLRANFDKTQAVWIGAKRGCGEELQITKKIIWNHKGTFKLLSIKYSLIKNDKYIDNFTEKIEKVKRLLNDWSFRNLSLIGRITVIKSLALPILIQCFTVLPDPPSHISKEIQDIFFRFLWNGKPDKVKRNTIFGNYQDGGLKMPHITSFISALKVTWIQKVLDSDNNAAWKVLITDVLDEIGGENFWHFTKGAMTKLSSKFNTFWKDVVKVWATLRNDPPTAPEEEILSQPLWYNDKIKIDKHTIFYPHWIREGIFFIRDLLKQGNFLSFIEFKEKFNIKTNFLEYYGVVQAIPQEWKQFIPEQFGKNSSNLDSIFSLICSKNKLTKPIYNILLKNTFENPVKIQNKWNQNLGGVNIIENWDMYYRIPFKNIQNSKLQSFQYKINLRFLYSNNMLYKCKLTETELCSFCFETKETLLHLFFECPKVRSLWLQFAQKLQQQCGMKLDLTPETCLFGTLFDSNFVILNSCCIIIRYYIYVCKLKNEMPNLIECLQILKYYKNLDIHSLHLCTPRQSECIKKKWESVNMLFQSDEST